MSWKCATDLVTGGRIIVQKCVIGYVNWRSPIHKEMLVDVVVYVGELVASENIGFVGPVGVLDVVYLGRDRSDNAEIVTSSLHSPPKVG